ncbi:MAG: GAF domain-containing SpoIIE family protein phosphatase [Candidatus Kryptoniota bacterium]
MAINLKNTLYLASAGTLAALLLFYDVVRIAIHLDEPNLNFIRYLFSILVYLFIYLALDSFWQRKQKGAMTTLRNMAGLTLIFTAITAAGSLAFETAGHTAYYPPNMLILLAVTLFGLTAGTGAIIILLLTGDLILFKADRKVRRRFNVLLILLISGSIIKLFPNSRTWTTLWEIVVWILVAVTIWHIVSMNWIVFLSRKQKYKALGYSLLLAILAGYGFGALRSQDPAGEVLLFYSAPMSGFVINLLLFVCIYFSMAFFVTIFHIPTTGAFERKKRELDSFQSLSRIITNALDPMEVLKNTVNVIGEVTQASKVWIELFDDATGKNQSGEKYRIGAVYNCTVEEVSRHSMESIRNKIKDVKRIILQNNEEMGSFGLNNTTGKSLLAIALMAHESFVGILYTCHNIPNAYDDEEVSTITAFADTAAVAIQNSLLFSKSLENERLHHELAVAHDMQVKLLPVTAPYSEKFELDFFSFPAFEVGGDYVDYALIGNGKYAFAVGDVSGKGTSAAFYMAYMKGVFQSLSFSTPSPVAFMLAANEAVKNTLQRNFFITLTYALLDSNTGRVLIVRAGHTPAVLVNDGGISLIRPAGIGLGMEDSGMFRSHLEEADFVLRSGDLLVLYTDGITDQRNSAGEDFGEERFYALLKEARNQAVNEIKGSIIRALAEFSQGVDAVDDTTVLILKWK